MKLMRVLVGCIETLYPQIVSKAAKVSGLHFLEKKCIYNEKMLEGNKSILYFKTPTGE